MVATANLNLTARCHGVVEAIAHLLLQRYRAKGKLWNDFNTHCRVLQNEEGFMRIELA